MANIAGVSNRRRAIPRSGRYPRPYEALRRAGLLDILCAAGLREADLDAARALIRFIGKTAIRDITSADVDAFIASHDEWHQRRTPWRRRLQRVFEAAGVSPNPIQVAPIRRAPRIEDFSQAIQNDIDRLRRHLEEQNFSRTTKQRYETLMIIAAGWISSRDPALSAKGLARPLLDDAIAREYAKWRARPKSDGHPISVNTFDWVYAFLRQLWLSAGLPRQETEHKIETLQGSFRRDGRRGRPDLLSLRAPSPEPGPSPEEIYRLFAHIQAEIDTAKTAGQGQTRTLRRLLTERAMVHTLVLTGMRAASLASMRAEQVRPDAANVWWVEQVLIKATPTRVRNTPTPRYRVADQEYSRWVLPAILIPMYQEMFAAYGLDLLEYVRTGRPEALRWVRLAEDTTFGRATPVGQEVAPFWLDWNGAGYLRRHRFAYVGERLMRGVLKIPRGRLHVLRRVAAFMNRELSVRKPGVVEMMLQMGPMQQVFYSLPIRQDLRNEVGSFDPFGGDLPSSLGAPASALVPSQRERSVPRSEPAAESPQLRDPKPAVNRKVASRSSSRLRLSDLFGD